MINFKSIRLDLVKYDLLSGLVVYLVALPLCLGIALASGAPLLSGLISGIIGGVVVGALSGSQVSVSGPAAGLATIVLASITKLGGFEIFTTALLLAGIFQMMAGYFKLGSLASYIPSNVIKGLLAAIGILLIIKQIPYLIGYDVKQVNTVAQSASNSGNAFTNLFPGLEYLNLGAVFVGVISISLLVFWDKKLSKHLKFLPAALVVVLIGMCLKVIFDKFLPTFGFNTHQLVQIPDLSASQLFSIHLPTLATFANYQVWLVAFTIAVVASIETLLNLEAVDNIDPNKRVSPPNRELFAQGVGNLFSGFLGGLPVTSVIVRSSVNIEAGGKTKLSAVIHGVLLLVCVLTIAPVLNMIPLTSLAAILIITGYKLAKVKLFKEMFEKGTAQFVPFAATILGIVFTDLLIGVFIGLSTSVFFLLRSNFKNPFTIQKYQLYTEEAIQIELPNQVSFLNKTSIKETLSNTPSNSKLIIDARRSDYIDHDVLEVFKHFREVTAPSKNIKINKLCEENKFDFFEHIQFVNVLDKETRKNLNPPKILEILTQGNERFVTGNEAKKEFIHQVNATSFGQNPMAVVLSCIDSRTTPELIFDANLGELISIRIAGNVVDDGILGSLELACQEIGTKLIVIMGHSNCGAINAAKVSIKNGNIRHITEKINLEMTCTDFQAHGDSICSMEAACLSNLQNSVDEIFKRSPYISSLVKKGQLGVVSAYYDTTSGKVKFGKLY